MLPSSSPTRSRVIQIVGLAFTTSAFAGEIPVGNPSFEIPNLSTCQWNNQITGWCASGTFGVWNPGLGSTCAPLNGFPSGVPDGDQVGFVNSVGAPLSQVLTATLQAGEPYSLLVDVGRRSDGFPMISYRIRLLAGGIVLAEDLNSVSPPQGAFATSTLTFTAPRGHPALGLPLEIQLSLVAGPQADFDNVRLTGPDGGSGAAGDINGDGSINALDLAVVLGGWGTCGLCDVCLADLNGDGVVNASDLAIVLGAWTG